MLGNCPICKKPVDSEKHAEFPFCSERCRILDLGNWASEKYVVSDPALEEPAPDVLAPEDPSSHDRKN
jgi:endogenous inhibitor of DNA gyrase (YacG/DUF329 family)